MFYIYISNIAKNQMSLRYTVYGVLAINTCSYCSETLKYKRLSLMIEKSCSGFYCTLHNISQTNRSLMLDEIFSN